MDCWQENTWVFSENQASYVCIQKGQGTCGTWLYKLRFADNYPSSGKSTFGYVYMLAGGAIAWKSVKQTLTGTSTMQAKFIAIYEGTCEGMWLKNFLVQTNIVDTIVRRPLKIFCNNTAAVFFTKNNKRSINSKHIDLKFYSAREKVKHREIEIANIGTHS